MTIKAIIVTYNSDIEKLSVILSLQNSQLEYIIVDNSTNSEKQQAISSLCTEKKCSYLAMKGNAGIAAAQNQGIIFALKQGTENVLLLDDDSIPAADMLDRLLSGRQQYAHISDSIPVVCANAVHDGDQSLYQLKNQIQPGLYECRDLISSGTLLHKSHFDKIGLLEEDLFIDCVDFEWGWRAIAQGYKILIVADAILNHRLGDGEVAVVALKYPSPVRHYYQYRNILKMMTRRYVPIKWRISQSIKLPVKLVLILLFLDKKKQRITYALKGVLDFMRNRSGAYKG